MLVNVTRTQSMQKAMKLKHHFLLIGNMRPFDQISSITVKLVQWVVAKQMQHEFNWT